MRMWSQGLGKNELVVDFRNYKVVEDVTPENVSETIIKGVTNEPVQWEFQIRMNPTDFSGLMNIVFQPATLFFVIRNFHQVLLFFFYKLFKKGQFAEVDMK